MMPLEYIEIGTFILILAFIVFVHIIIKKKCKKKKDEDHASTVSYSTKQNKLISENEDASEVVPDMTSKEESTIAIKFPSTATTNQKKITLSNDCNNGTVPKNNNHTFIYLILGNENHNSSNNSTQISIDWLKNTEISNTNSATILQTPKNNFALQNENTFASAPIKDEYFKQLAFNPIFQNVPTLTHIKAPEIKPPKEIKIATNDSAKISPKLIIYHIHSNNLKEEKEFLETFIRQNKLSHSQRSISIVHKQVRGEFFNIIIAVDPKTREILLRTKQVHVGRTRCKCEDSFYIVQCYRCAGFGHMQSSCNRKKLHCLKCANNHETKTCSNAIPCCINCKMSNGKSKTSHDIGHSAKDKKCPIYEDQIVRLKSKTNYDID